MEIFNKVIIETTHILTIIHNILNIKSQSLLIPIKIGDNKKVKEIQAVLQEKEYLVGAIRQPSVKSVIIRLISKIDINENDLIRVCKILKELK